MYTVYILKNAGSERHYVGCTENLDRRILEHNAGRTKSTKANHKWEVIYKEEYSTLTEARRREKKIKSFKSGNAFKELVAGVVYR